MQENKKPTLLSALEKVIRVIIIILFQLIIHSITPEEDSEITIYIVYTNGLTTHPVLTIGQIYTFTTLQIKTILYSYVAI